MKTPAKNTPPELGSVFLALGLVLALGLTLWSAGWEWYSIGSGDRPYMVRPFDRKTGELVLGESLLTTVGAAVGIGATILVLALRRRYLRWIPVACSAIAVAGPAVTIWRRMISAPTTLAEILQETGGAELAPSQVKLSVEAGMVLAIGGGLVALCLAVVFLLRR